jgi:hypothetical protein
MLKKSCNFCMKGVQLQLLLLFNQSWCIPPNEVSHRSQVNGIPAVQSMGANTADLGSIRSAGDLAIVLLESTTMAARWYFLGISRLRRCGSNLRQPEQYDGSH